MIDLRRLQVLRAVHQHGTVTAAAAALHLTPSAVSHQLRELGRELKLTLIEPQGRGIRLTPAALVVIEHSDALLARWEEAQVAFESYRNGAGGLLRIAGFSTAVSGLIAPACALLKSEHPELSVRVTECEVPDAFDRLLSHDADLVLISPTGSGPDPGDPRFDQQPLMREPLDLLVPAGHPLERQDVVRLSDAAADTWVLPAPGTCDHHQRVMVHCAVAGFTPRIGHHAIEWTAISALVAHGLGISMIPRMAEVPRDHAVVRVPLTEDPVPTRQVLSCVRRGSRDHPLIQHALGALRKIVDAKEVARAAWGSALGAQGLSTRTTS